MPESYLSEKSASTFRPEDAKPHPYDKHAIGNTEKNNLWKAPENWECTSLPAPPPNSSARPPWGPNSDENSLSGSNVFQLHKSLLRRMRTASPNIMLERLTEEWTDPTDATINEELQFEKQLWMRTALHACFQMSMTEKDSSGHRSAPKPEPAIPEAVKILSLYEDHGMFMSHSHRASTPSFQPVTKDISIPRSPTLDYPRLPPKLHLSHINANNHLLASLTFLSSLNSSSTSEIHHLSTAPSISANIYSLSVPSPNPHLPYAPHLFASIRASLSLTAQLPSSALPTLLKECHRVLRKRGALHLTLIDPCPIAATLGPIMREWLDSHLLLELERNFRCTNPCRLVPGWCADAGFDASSTTLSRMRFAAATETAPLSSQTRFGWRGVEGAAAGTREGLKAVVGMMLWEECWGGFCADGEGEDARRWWEDREVMEECVEMGTAWDILVVETLKDS
jgi:hypothetical protein